MEVPRQTILVIDDSPAIAALVRARLHGEPVDLLTADTGVAGLELAACRSPDLILLDVDMPDPDGFEVCRRLKAEPKTAEIPVIFLTGVSSTEDKLKGLTLGAIDYIAKPFDPAELRARVKAALRTRELMTLLARRATLERERAAVLQMIAERQPVPAMLERVTELVEGQYAQSLASVVLLAEGRLEHTAPRLPAAFRAEFDAHLLRVTAAICSDTLSAGSSLAHGEFENDPRWLDAGHCAAAHGLVTWWAHVIRSTEGEPLGMLALYHRRPCSPGEEDRSLLDNATRLIALAHEHRELTWRMDYRAHHDPLTGLPNRVVYEDRLQQALARAAREGGVVSLLYFDLDRFKQVNDTLGHHAGDMLLIEVAQRARAVLRSSDTLARLGGDEFAMVLASSDGPAEVAGRLLIALQDPFVIRGHEVFIGGSLGSAQYPRDGRDAEELQCQADAALYRAKAQGRNRYQPFEPSMLSGASQRLSLEGRLRRAVQNRELQLYYQPQFDRDCRLIQVEALVRWHDRELGIVPPAGFIPVAEETGLIVPIGRWVLDEACRQYQQWRRAGLAPDKVAVNVSARQFADGGLLESIKQAIGTHRIDPRSLEVEITETLVMRNDLQTASKLASIRELGVSIAMDDFGTGYSSLAYLRRLPIDTLKIDATFVRDVGHRADHDDGRGMIQAIVALGHHLGMKVIAEGVETQAQHEFVRAIGCDQMQGYWYGKPATAEELEPLLRKLKLTREQAGGLAGLPRAS